MRSCLARVPPGVFPTKRIVLVLRVVSSCSCSPLFFLPLFFHLLLILAVSSFSTTSLSFFLFLGQSPISAQNRWISQGWLFCNSKSVLYHTNGRRIKVQYLGKLVFTCFVSYSQLIIWLCHDVTFCSFRNQLSLKYCVFRPFDNNCSCPDSIESSKSKFALVYQK